MDEIGILKLRLENAIHGHEISLSFYYDKETEDMLNLLKDCHAVISRIKLVYEDDLK